MPVCVRIQWALINPCAVNPDRQIAGVTFPRTYNSE